MKENLFLETIKVKDGVFYNLPLHISRMQRTAKHFFGSFPDLLLESDMIPEEMRSGLVKCRVLYNRNIVSVTFEPYRFREINKLRILEDDAIEYTYKSADRNCLNELLAQTGDCDDILIVKNNLVTDTSYANVVFEKSGVLHTPYSYLLNGVKRQALINKGIITEAKIELDHIPSYSNIYLINAMIDLEDQIKLPLTNLV